MDPQKIEKEGVAVDRRKIVIEKGEAGVGGEANEEKERVTYAAVEGRV